MLYHPQLEDCPIGLRFNQALSRGIGPAAPASRLHATTLLPKYGVQALSRGIAATPIYERPAQLLDHVPQDLPRDQIEQQRRCKPTCCRSH